jgi:hypothetical protein
MSKVICSTLKLSCDSRFQRAFTACCFVFKVITLAWANQGNYFENANACSKRTLKTTVATQLKFGRWNVIMMHISLSETTERTKSFFQTFFHINFYPSPPFGCAWLLFSKETKSEDLVRLGVWKTGLRPPFIVLILNKVNFQKLQLISTSIM